MKASIKILKIALLLGVAPVVLSAQSAWQRLPKAFKSVTQIRFFDEERGFLLSNRDTLVADTLWTTTNGGEAWQPLPLPLDSGSRLTSFYMFKQDMWIACRGAIARKTVRLLHSSDLGSSWKVLDFDSSFYPVELCFPTLDKGYVLYNIHQSAVYGHAFTADRGEHWTIRNRFEQEILADRLRIGYENTLLMTVRRGSDPPAINAVISFDSGVSFPLTNQDPPCNQYTYCGDRVWLTCIGNRSEDDGHSWKLDSPSADLFYFWSDTTGDIYAQSPGLSDSFSVSHDRGETYSRQPFCKGEYPYLIEVVNHNVAYAVAGHYVYGTMTGGIGEFNSVASSTNHSLKQAMLVGSTMNVAATSNFSILTICDLAGRPRLLRRMSVGGNEVSLADLPTGVYVAMLDDARWRFVKR